MQSQALIQEFLLDGGAEVAGCEVSTEIYFIYFTAELMMQRCSAALYLSVFYST